MKVEYQKSNKGLEADDCLMGCAYRAVNEAGEQTGFFLCVKHKDDYYMADLVDGRMVPCDEFSSWRFEPCDAVATIKARA